MKSHLSLILWSKRSTALCSLLRFGTVVVKLGARRATSPAVKSLAPGMMLHVAFIAGLRPRLRGSRGLHVGAEPTSHAKRVTLSLPVVGIIWPMRGSSSLQGLEQAATSSVGVGLRLNACTTPPILNFKIPARRASDGTA